MTQPDLAAKRLLTQVKLFHSSVILESFSALLNVITLQNQPRKIEQKKCRQKSYLPLATGFSFDLSEANFGTFASPTLDRLNNRIETVYNICKYFCQFYSVRHKSR